MKNNNLKRNILFAVVSTVALGSSAYMHSAPKMTVEHQKAAEFAENASKEIQTFFSEATAMFYNSAKPKMEASAKKFKTLLTEFKPNDAAGIVIRNMMLKSLKEFIETIKKLKGSGLKQIKTDVNAVLDKMEVEFAKTIITISKMPNTALLVAKLQELSRGLKAFESKYGVAKKALIARKIKKSFALPDLSELQLS